MTNIEDTPLGKALTLFAQEWIEQAKQDGRLVQHIDGTWRLARPKED